MVLSILVGATSTGGVTINYNGSGAKSLLSGTAAALVAGAVQAGQQILAQYVAATTNYRLLARDGGNPQFAAPLPITQGGTGANTAAGAVANLGLAEALVFGGNWNASTNSPAFTSGTGSPGVTYVVSVAGTTTLDGISSWNVGDKAVFNGLSNTWNKIDGLGNEVTSVAGRTGPVTLAVADVSGAVASTSIGAANGVAGLDANGCVPSGQLQKTLGSLILPPSQLATFRAALNQTRLGVSNTNIAVAGDSMVFGYNGASGGSAPQWPKNLTYWLAQYLNLGVPNMQNGNFGFSNGEYFTNNPRWSLGTGWSSGYGGFGGNLVQANSTTSTPMVFTPGSAIDTFIVWYLAFSSGSFTVTGTGGSAVTATSVNDAAIHYITVPCGSLSSSNTASFRWVSGNAFVTGAFGYNSAAPSLNIYNSGWVSSRMISSQWNDTSDVYAPINEIATMKFPLILYEAGPNDWANGVSASTWAAGVQQIITAQKSWGGNIILFIGTPTNGTAQSVQTQYAQAMEGLAATNNIPFIDTNTIYGNYSTGLANGLYAPNNDGTHFGPAGYADEARLIASYLNTL
jgi:hypothetical protein